MKAAKGLRGREDKFLIEQTYSKKWFGLPFNQNLKWYAYARILMEVLVKMTKKEAHPKRNLHKNWRI